MRFGPVWHDAALVALIPLPPATHETEEITPTAADWTLSYEDRPEPETAEKRGFKQLLSKRFAHRKQRVPSEFAL